MASNRVERQLMRQRGAGTRQVKEVDFGFSLFGPPAGESSQPPASQPTNEPDPATAPQPPSLNAPALPETNITASQTQSNLTPTRSNASSQNPAVRRTPGSARNKLPPRRSTFDIPAEDEPELGRSSKRRKIESPKDTSPLIGAQAEVQNIEAVVQNGSIEEPVAASEEGGRAIPIRTIASNQTELPSQGSAAPAPSIPVDDTIKSPSAPDHASSQLAPEIAEKSAQRTNGTASPPSDTSSRRGKGRKKSGERSQPQKDASTEPADQAVIQSTDLPQPPQPPQPTEEPQRQESFQPEAQRAREKRTRSRTPATEQQAQRAPVAEKPTIEDSGLDSAEALLQRGPDESEPQRTRERKARSRTPASAQVERSPTGDQVPAEVANAGAASETGGKGRRGRKPKNAEPVGEAPGVAQQHDEARSIEAETQPSPGGTTGGASQTQQEQPNGIEKGKKRAGRPKKQHDGSSQPSEETVAVSRKRQHEEPEKDRDVQGNDSPEQDHTEGNTSRAGKRRKPRAESEPSPRQEEQAEPEPESRPRAGRRKQHQEGPPPPDERPEPDAEIQTSREKRKQRSQDRGKEAEEQAESEPAVEQARVGRGRKRRQERASSPEHEPRPAVEQAQARKGKKRQRAPTPEQEEQGPEPGVEQQVQTDQRPNNTQRRGRRPTTQPEEAEETTEEPPQATKRKPRQPRGETVPVTVHRLANAASLGGAPVESASEDEAESPDEIAERQPTKLPSRGGVNPADVLAQICRETLEKTLTTLKNGIANEVNTARRAEWTLRRKAVEAFGTELEGRLFDLSEMLDSNFMLSAKVKKAKRNMMDLRSRLDHVRREREAVALKMDAVRREHSKEEHAGMARSTINHSLHNLDLALERGRNQGQNRPTQDEPLTAGLELRLRNVARNVSSSAPGAQGGLLSQIKAFNAQLEATAKRLEG
ncbi:hypothetical protein BDV18DRAFT_161858 [Aspergillus unguis]